MYSLDIHSLSKVFSKTIAVDDISFTVNDGEVFGFLGPNGAGKSTTMMMLTTLLKPTSGKAVVGGFDVTNDAKKVREIIGFVQQETTVDEYLTGRENLKLQARLNHIPKHIAEKRIDEVLELIELTKKQHEPVLNYSGGMRKRLDIAGGLLHMPKILFLDEPTVGLDIQTRRKIWNYIKKIHQEFDMTIFLSTHYMEEADNLCDRIGIIDHGKIQVIDSPSTLKNKLGNQVIVITLQNDSVEFITKIKQLPDVEKVTFVENQITIFSSQSTKVIPKVFQISSDLKMKIESISLTKPTLDDVFLSFTGHDLRDDEGAFNRSREHAKMKRLRP